MNDPAPNLSAFKKELAKFSFWAGLIALAFLGFAHLFESMACLQILFFVAPLAVLAGLLFFILLPFSKHPKGTWKWALLGTILGGVGSWGLIYISILATTGCRISSVRHDLRSTSIALETYFLDNRTYPTWSADPRENAFDETKANIDQPTFRTGPSLITLTTPVTYLSSFFMDSFAPTRDTSYCYWTDASANTTATGYILWSTGPDGLYDITLKNVARVYNPKIKAPSNQLLVLTYDPTNGILSRGDIYRYKE